MKPRVFAAALLLHLASAHLAQAQVPSFSRIFVVIFENKEYGDVIGNPAAPFMNSLAQQYGLATSEFALVHPSLPNYMALTSGDTAFTSDCVDCQTPVVNIADRIEASGRAWTAYMEDMPAPCSATDSGLYVAKHNPFVHYTNIMTNPARCTQSVLPFAQFSADLAANRLSDFVWITPNLCNDMHDCGVGAGDAWLAALVPQIMQSPSFDNALLLVVWDEGTSSAGGGGHVPLIVVSSSTPAGLQVGTTFTHDNVLRTIEDAWGLAPLGRSANATAMTAFFPSATPPTAPAEQVIHAADVSTVAGAWRTTADVSAADGVKLSYPDNGAPPLDSPAASPASYVDATFQAQVGVRYRVWLRIHATADSKFNDSAWVQFADSVDAFGNPIYRIGTSGGYIVNLWTCATCQSFGWGWQRNAYWLSDSGDVWFPTGGTHTIRVQAREDGVEFDQIVISPSTYATNPPGPVSMDSTILPSTKGSAPPPPAATNLARNRLVLVSSIEASQYAGSNAVDGSTSTRWSSQFSDPQWILVDLGQTVNVSEVILRWETAFGADYQLLISDDGNNWRTLRTVTNGDGGVDDLSSLSGSGRYVGVYGTRRGTPWGYSLWEMEVYGSAMTLTAK